MFYWYVLWLNDKNYWTHNSWVNKIIIALDFEMHSVSYLFFVLAYRVAWSCNYFESCIDLFFAPLMFVGNLIRILCKLLLLLTSSSGFHVKLYPVTHSVSAGFYHTYLHNPKLSTTEILFVIGSLRSYFERYLQCNNFTP